jgi:hypothetical protein
MRRDKAMADFIEQFAIFPVRVFFPSKDVLLFFHQTKKHLFFAKITFQKFNSKCFEKNNPVAEKRKLLD